MNVRRLLGFLVAILATGFLVPLAAHALTICDPTLGCSPTSDTLEVTDLAGNVLNDAYGNLAFATTPESGEAIALIVDIPESLLPAGFSPNAVALVDTAPDSSGNTMRSDLVTSFEHQSSPPSIWRFELQSDTQVGQPENCSNPSALPGFIPCVVETGALQDVTPFLFPGLQPNFKVLVLSAQVVPEPGTLLLLGSGLAGLAVARVRRHRV